MSEWSTYGLSDFLMFSGRTWYRMLELHNRAWWPLQPVLMAVGTGLLWSLRSDRRFVLRLGLVLLGALQLFVAWAFHWQRYADINWGARYLALAFAAQGLLLLALGLLRRDLLLAHGSAAARAGAGMLFIAVLLFPILVLASQRPLAQSEWFGLHPDPTMLATLGLLLCLRSDRSPRHTPMLRWLPLLLPMAWCAVSGATLWSLGAAGWFVMPAAGIAALLLAWRQPG